MGGMFFLTHFPKSKRSALTLSKWGIKYGETGSLDGAEELTQTGR
jgi:hypothetical protein